MSRPNTTITVHGARADQLRDLAKARGIVDPQGVPRMHELIEDIINRAIAAGELQDKLPGFNINMHADRVSLAIGDMDLPPLPKKIINAQLAPALEHYAKSESVGRAVKFDLPDGFTLTIGRLGKGLILKAHDLELDHESKATLTPTMARDLARQLVNAAKNQ